MKLWGKEILKVFAIIFGVLILSTVSAEHIKVSPDLKIIVNGKEIPVSKEKIGKIEKLLNSKNATLGDIIKIASPECLKSFSYDEMLLLQMKFPVPDDIDKCSNIVKGKMYLDNRISSINKKTIDGIIPLLLMGQSDMSVSSYAPIIEYSADTRVLLPPYFPVQHIGAGAGLFKKTNDGSELIRIVVKTGTYKSYIEASSKYYVSESGYYRVCGEHRVIDERCVPSYWEGHSQTEWEYVKAN